LQQRAQADIVLPFEVSQQTTLPWVDQGYAVIREAAASADACVVVGLSYQECDRPEIDSITRRISPDTTIWLVDPAVGSAQMKDFENALKSVSPKVNALTPDDFLRL
jgi:hypothetical protein